jgi:hypothetical protein
MHIDLRWGLGSLAIKNAAKARQLRRHIVRWRATQGFAIVAANSRQRRAAI